MMMMMMMMIYIDESLELVFSFSAVIFLLEWL